jgi:glycosyltransferase involved in cell wall biosynthesis
MRIVLGTPVYNEINFIDTHLKNALAVGFDEIVYLDDGSTDGTYEKLLEFKNAYDHVHIIRQEDNSVQIRGTNRWMVLSNYCREFDTDWIMVRSADECFSKAAFKNGDNLLYKRLEECLENKIDMVGFPFVHLWRSKYWFRSDGEWGHSAMYPVNDSCWNNRVDWRFVSPFDKSGMHLGAHRPNYFDGKEKMNKASLHKDLDGSIPLIVVLHYGMSSDNLLTKKLDYQMTIADKIGGGNGLPTTKKMPHPAHWYKYNGYKIGHEITLKLTKIYDKWFDIPNDIVEPKVKSLYHIIRKHNEIRANEYKELYDKCFGGK